MSTGFPFVVTYYLYHLIHIVKDYLNILYIRRDPKAVFYQDQWFNLEVHVKLVAT